MIYMKMALRSIVRSKNDYLLYLVTLILCVGLFYSFLSISSNYYHPNIGVNYDISMLGEQMKLATIVITLVLVFLIRFVNHFMISRKQKEFALQTIMGMERKTTAFIFFIEIFVMGLIALGIGLALGTVLTQIITALLMSAYGENYQFMFTLFPDTALLSICFFLVIFIVVGVSNTKVIRKIKIIDMFHANRKNELFHDSSFWDRAWFVMEALFSILQFIQGFYIYQIINDARIPIIPRVIACFNMIFPFLFCGIFIVFIFFTVKHHKNKNRLLLIAIITSFLMVLSALAMVGVKQHFYLPIESNIINVLLICAGTSFFFCICVFFQLIGITLEQVKKRFLNIRYHNENLFLFGQLTSKMKTASKTMSIITISMVLSIILCILSSIIPGWISGFAKNRDIFDIQASSIYNDISDPKTLQELNYATFIQEFLYEHDILMDKEISFHTFFLEHDDFYRRNKYDFPILAMRVSDYNDLLQATGNEVVSLPPDTFTTQWYITATKQEKDDFLEAHQTINMNGTKLTMASDNEYSISLGEGIYNSYSSILFIVPDNLCTTDLIANTYFYANTEMEMSYEIAKVLSRQFDENNKKEQTDMISEIRLKTLQSNQSIAYAFLARAMMLYAGIVLLIICFTILSVQQLAEASDFSERFRILRKLGVEEKRINKIGLKQIGIWFGLPILVSIGSAISLLSFFISNSGIELIAYVGTEALIKNILIVTLSVFILLISYFICTWKMFQKNIH